MLYSSYSVFHKEFPVLLKSLSSTRSSESFIWLFSISTFVMMCLQSLAPLRASNSSSLGKETFLRGAIFVLDVIRVTMHSSSSGKTVRCAAAQYAHSLALQRTCTVRLFPQERSDP